MQTERIQKELKEAQEMVADGMKKLSTEEMHVVLLAGIFRVLVLILRYLISK